MKVLHLNTHSEGGSYVYAEALSQSLLEMGVESRVITRDARGRPFLDKVLRRIMLWFARGAWHGTRRKALPPDPELLENVDVVHLHTVADWFDLPKWLEELPTRIRVVVSLHDLWHISGGCFVYRHCERFKTGCGNCPLLCFPANRLLAADEVRRKTLAHVGRKSKFVANSQWLKTLVEESAVINGAEVVVIPPPIDTSVFRLQDRAACRVELGLKPDDLVVVTGCASLTDLNKDTAGLLEILSSLKEPRLKVVVFGDGTIPAPSGLEVRWLGSIGSKEHMARVYAAADVFASASRMETYGLTLAEAQACGTRVVAYRVGGIPEAVRESDGALLCKPFDAVELREALASTLRACDSFIQSPPRPMAPGQHANGGAAVARMAVKIYSL